jgi:iron complex transport system ATP-binding protein
MSALLTAESIAVARGSRRVLCEFSLEAAAGSVTALLGPNGAGKSSALKALAGLLPCAEGRVRLAGRDLSDFSVRDRARARAYLPQHSQLQSGFSVRDVVSQGRYAHRSAWPTTRERKAPAVEAALAAAQLGPLAERAFDRLSGGEQRRVLLARALASEAPVLLLDEPTSGLDVAHALRLFELLTSLAARGLCIVLSLHDLDQALRHTERVLLLDRGRTVASGPSARVISAPNVHAVYGVQLEDAGGLRFRLPEPER